MKSLEHYISEKLIIGKGSRMMPGIKFDDIVKMTYDHLDSFDYVNSVNVILSQINARINDVGVDRSIVNLSEIKQAAIRIFRFGNTNVYICGSGYNKEIDDMFDKFNEIKLEFDTIFWDDDTHFFIKHYIGDKYAIMTVGIEKYYYCYISVK